MSDPALSIVYTALFGGYEPLNEQPVAATSSMRFVCFTDDASLVSSSWEVRVVEPALPLDPVRSARRIKVLGPPGMEPESTLWLDNSLILGIEPEEILADWLAEADLAAPVHSYRASVADEFTAVVEEQRDDPGRVHEQLAHYLEAAPAQLQLRPLWTALLARRRTDLVARFDAAWYEHILRYSRRDQLSVRIALASVPELRLREVQLDNFASILHRWPASAGRRQHDVQRDPLAALTPLSERVRVLEQEVDACRSSTNQLRADLAATREQNDGLVQSNHQRETQLEALERELLEVRRSATWRVGRVVVRALRPLRWLRRRRSPVAGGGERSVTTRSQ